MDIPKLPSKFSSQIHGKYMYITNGSHYTLCILKPDYQSDSPIGFLEEKKKGQQKIKITGRLWAAYDTEIKRKLPYIQEFTFVEVGPGFGGALLHIEEHIQPHNQSIAIDSANYPLMSTFLDAMLQKEWDRATATRLQDAKRRVDWYLSDHVRLYNTSIAQALRDHPELKQSADVLIDNKGPFLYWQHEPWCRTHLAMYNKELSLLKADGISLFSQYRDFAHKEEKA